MCVTPGEVSEASRGKGGQERWGRMGSLPLALLAEREAGNDTVGLLTLQKQAWMTGPKPGHGG